MNLVGIKKMDVRPASEQSGEVHDSLDPLLPLGVITLKPLAEDDIIFWIHYVHVDLARELEDGYQTVFITLSPQDTLTLGERPNLQSIAACMVHKLVATQPMGPYVVGGSCLGGILAYEMASQLQAAGREVSLVILLDTPNPSYFKSRNSLGARLSEPRYLLRRAVRLGPWESLVIASERLLGSDLTARKATAAETERRRAQQLLETAASHYKPNKYHGRVLLMLAADRAPHVNFLPGWQALVPHNLHTCYVNAHHSDLTQAPIIRTVATTIASHLCDKGGN